MAIDVQELKKRLVTLLEDENLANEYIRRYGPKLDIKHIKKLKDTKKMQVHEDDGSGEDPVYQIVLKCPVCNNEQVPSYELRAKSQAIQYNKFMTPIYEGAMGYRTVNYSRLAVSVCVRCLFSSPDKKDFISTSSTSRNALS
jgi:hypothetical protein